MLRALSIAAQFPDEAVYCMLQSIAGLPIVSIQFSYSAVRITV